ncbi:hypothetical protein [Bacillus nitroreducens]
MQINITSVAMRYGAEEELDSVQVFFNGNDENHEININGYVPLTAEKYTGNESIPALTEIVKETVANRLLES